MAKRKLPDCSRPYRLGKRQEATEHNRARILDAARDLLAKEGIVEFSMDAVARHAGVTRQTIHNQFGTRPELIEALFDRMATRGGIEGLGRAMREPDPVAMLTKFVEVFVQFWSSDRVTIRRIHGLAALDAELGQIDRARNERRRRAAARVVDALAEHFGKPAPAERSDAIDLLFTATSFEFFDSFAGSRSPENVSSLIARLVLASLGVSN